MEKIFNGLKSFLKTIFCFIIALLLLPILLLSFICAHFSNELANYILSIKYPSLTISKSKKVRTLIDTPKNAGIFHFLLQVQGPCNYDRIKQHYQELLTDLRDKTGQYRFPKLRQQLVTCWGHYAWVNDTSAFNINNHVLLSTQKYRGRNVNDANIEDFISELARKYIPSDLPQWQVIVIPITLTENSCTESPVIADEHYYILIKIHHLIIAEEDDLHVSEILLLRNPERKTVLDIDDDSIESKTQQLSHFVRQPAHIQRLFQHIWKQIVSRWQQFIYEFESLETPDGLKQPKITNISQLLSLLLIVVVNVGISYYRTMQLRRKLQRRSSTYRTPSSKWQTLQRLLLQEVSQCKLNWSVARLAVSNSCRLRNIIKTLTSFIWQFHVNTLLMLPYRFYIEAHALFEVMFLGQTKYNYTYCAQLYVYVPLLIYAQLELFKIAYEIFKAPRNIYEVFFVHPTRELNVLHKKSYSGRKIVSFTKSIDSSALRAHNTFSSNVRESDFSLTCLAGAVHDYLAKFENELPVPRLLNTTCRTISKSYFTDNVGDKSVHIGGVVFLQLPLKKPDREQIQQIHNIVEHIRDQQIMLYLASMGQTKYSLLTSLFPQVLTKIGINFFSYNFPVTITEIYGDSAEFQTAWGQKVTDVLLFRPPQSKTCLSLNLHRFGDKYRLAIMADTQLAPDHTKIARAFEHYMEKLVL